MHEVLIALAVQPTPTPYPSFREETHKNDVLQFTCNQAADNLKDSNLMDRQSTALIWDFLSILVRQNGVSRLIKGYYHYSRFVELFKCLSTKQPAVNIFV